MNVRPETIARNIGKRYGRLVIQSFSKKTSRTEYFYNCLCDCGTLKEIRHSCMQQGSTLSCGCLQKDANNAKHKGNKYRRLAPGEAAKNTLFSRYRRDAERRNLVFQLDLEYFSEITIANCYYCGAKPSSEHGADENNGKYVYNGVDRVDNTIGYVPGNCVACCKSCNALKGAVTPEIIRKAAQFIAERALFEGDRRDGVH